MLLIPIVIRLGLCYNSLDDVVQGLGLPAVREQTSTGMFTSVFLLLVCFRLSLSSSPVGLLFSMRSSIASLCCPSYGLEIVFVVFLSKVRTRDQECHHCGTGERSPCSSSDVL